MIANQSPIGFIKFKESTFLLGAFKFFPVWNFYGLDEDDEERGLSEEEDEERT
jgi:hypothetical protein